MYVVTWGLSETVLVLGLTPIGNGFVLLPVLISLTAELPVRVFFTKGANEVKGSKSARQRPPVTSAGKNKLRLRSRRGSGKRSTFGFLEEVCFIVDGYIASSGVLNYGILMTDTKEVGMKNLRVRGTLGLYV